MHTQSATPVKALTQEGVWNPNVVDLLTFNKKSNEFVFHIIEPREWTDLPTQLAQLRQKVRSYLTYVLDGDLVNDYPESIGRGISFRLDCTHPPRDQANRFVDKTAHTLDELGIRFVVKMIDNTR